MAKATRGKGLTFLWPFLLFYIGFTILYTCLVFFTSPFLMTWGEKRNAFEKVYAFFLSYPFDAGVSLWLVLANAFVWSFLIYIIGACCAKLVSKRSRNGSSEP